MLLYSTVNEVKNTLQQELISNGLAIKYAEPESKVLILLHLLIDLLIFVRLFHEVAENVLLHSLINGLFLMERKPGKKLPPSASMVFCYIIIATLIVYH